MHNPKFTSSWWDSFLKESNNFSKPITIHNVFEEEVPLLKDHLLQSMKRLVTLPEPPYGIWINHDNRNDLQNLVREGFSDNEVSNIDEFVASFFTELNFAIVAHHTNAYYSPLAVQMHNYVRPLIETMGRALKGMDLNVFIGNYGWTPFGIHQDGVGENVIHFHLGPAKKTMYLWDPEVFEPLKSKTFDEIIENAQYKFEIEAGDIFFMPEGLYHIGYTPEYSIGLTIWFCKPTKQMFRDKIMRGFPELLTTTQNQELQGVLGFEKDMMDQAYMATLFKECFNDFQNTPYKPLIEGKIKDYIYNLNSNLGFTRELFIDETGRELSEDDHVSIDHPYKITFYQNEGESKLYYFVKGSKFESIYTPEIVKTISELNEGKTISVKSCDHSNQKQLMNFLNQLLNSNAIVKQMKSETILAARS